MKNITLLLFIWASMLAATLCAQNDADYRTKLYVAYENPHDLAKKLKTSAYNQYENPTGIYFDQGEEIVVKVGDTSQEKIQIKVCNFGEEGGESVYPLKQGENKFIAKNRGNAYIQYFTDNYKTAKPIQVQILTGQENPCFDLSKHTNKDWTRILANGKGDIIDIVGKKVQLAYPRATLRQYCPEKGVELISIYDRIIQIQHDLMGLTKYKMEPRNHMFGRVIWRGFMHADGKGAAFHNNTLKELADPDKVLTNSWGIAHEFGHVNQVRPNMKWVGTTEVTNNIYSAWVQYLFTPDQLRLEHERIKGYDAPVTGGRFNSYFESAFIHNQEWLSQGGPDRWERDNGKNWGGDHFVKLCPLWQLQLFFVAAGEGNSWKCKDFYADIFKMAYDDQPIADNGRNQLNFMRRACDVSKRDLTDFFEKSGMLKPIDKYLDDYTCAQMVITEQDVKELKAYAKRYKKVETPVMHYITGNTVQVYKSRKPVQGKFNQGVEVSDSKMIVDHNLWKNATVFETYQGDKLVKIAMNGTGSKDNQSTTVFYPSGSTRVEAVAWNGARTLVYGVR